METQLRMKLTKNTPYTNQELDWLLVHIGDPDPAIRDDLVYASFCHIFGDKLATPLQFQTIAKVVCKQKLLDYRPKSEIADTLTRSFTALLVAILLSCDAEEEFPYRLTDEQRTYFFTAAQQFLSASTDMTGYHTDYGWVHSVAHGADFLLYASLHPAFPEIDIVLIWQSCLAVLRRSTVVFGAGEESRMAQIFSQLVLHKRLMPSQLTEWISQQTFLDGSHQDYARLLNWQHFLACLYFQLKKDGAVEPCLDQTISQQLQDI